MTKEELIAQENEIKKLWEEGEIPYLTHLEGGNEEPLLSLFSQIKRDDWVFCSHRAHYKYSLHGHSDLIEKVKAGKSMFLYGPRFIQSAIVAGVCGIAAGMALAIKERGGDEQVWCFCGDGATDEGAFWEAARFVEGRDLPCTFIVEDNGSQCGVTKDQRWGNFSYSFQKKVFCYQYVPVYPHAGTSVRPNLKWTPNVPSKEKRPA